jgi:DDE superfamily endonuclease
MDYCQFLLCTQTNYTLTYFAEHKDGVSHDAINRYLAKDKLTPALVWEHVKRDVDQSEEGYLIFDDVVLDKRDSASIEITKWQYSGNEGRVINGIGIVTCVYYQPKVKRFWAIDYRIYSPEEDGKSKLQHVHDMLQNAIFSKNLNFKIVLMDTWYATDFLMKEIDRLGKIFYCAIKSNRLASSVNQKYEYKQVKEFEWSKEEQKTGVRIHFRRWPQYKHLQLFRIEVSSNRTDYVVTNDLAQLDANAAQKEYGIRFLIEQLHRELKQTTGIDQCQRRKGRIQRNHIASAFLVWIKLKQIAYQTSQTVYQLKESLLKNYLIDQLRNPYIHMNFA